jgi:hypothetical protein
MDFEISVVMVRLARQEGFDLAARHFFRQPPNLRLGVCNDNFVALGLAELDQADIVLKLALGFLDRSDRVVEMLALAHDRLRLIRLVPEVGAFDADVQLLQAADGDIPVKDASGSGRARF